MQPTFAIIPVHTERQAMDWSLVLVSEGIEATIERNVEGDKWQLVVNSPDYSRAIHALRQYRIENRSQVWRQEFPGTGLIFDWSSAFVVLFLLFIHAVEASGRGNLRAVGLMDNHAVHAGQWWRMFTAVALHSDVGHLAANATTGLLLLGLAMGAVGPGFGLFASFLAGVAGNLAGYLFYPDNHRGLGASGMVMGALGLLAAQSLVLLRHGLSHRQLAIRGVASACLLLVLLGFSPERNVDVLAHVAGFVAGLGLGAILAWSPAQLLNSAPWNRVMLALSFATLLIPWLLALRSV